MNRLTCGDLMHVKYILTGEMQFLGSTKAYKPKFPEKSKLVLGCAKAFDEFIQKQQDPQLK